MCSFPDEALRCECGYEVQASDEAARVDEVRRHASEAHGIDLSADQALAVVRRGAGALSRQDGLGDAAAKRDAGAAKAGKGTS